MTTPAWQTLLDEREDAHLEELFELIRIPTVSTDPAHAGDMRAGAEWVAARMRRAGVPEVELIESGGHPVVYGRWAGAEGKPTVLVYGHYDVQPADPLELWQTPAFEPTVRDGRIYARGVADMKANLVTVLQAIEALGASNGALPVNLVFLFEGEEEIGSAHTPQVLIQHKEKFGADIVLSCDGGMEGPDQPGLLVGLKGITAIDVTLRTAEGDLHSGMYGSTVPNALQAMAKLAASFHTDDGKVAVAGFYDDVVELTDEERAEIARIGQSDDDVRREAKAFGVWGEPGYSAVERQFARPTLDFNGIWGGFQGAGSKTVTPCEAHLKITCRLVPKQDPLAIVALLEHHIATHARAGARVDVTRTELGARAYLLPRDNPYLEVAKRVLGENYGVEPLIVRSGGSVPITERFKTTLGLDTVTIGFGLPGSQVHAPNEWHRVEDLPRARTIYARFFEEAATVAT